MAFSLLTPGMVWITLGISIVLPLLLGLYESNLPAPSLNLEHIIGYEPILYEQVYRKQDYLDWFYG